MVSRPDHVKYRREDDGGLVYDHENYGYEDATLLTVDETVIRVLEAVDGGVTARAELEAEFSAEVIDALADRGLLSIDA